MNARRSRSTLNRTKLVATRSGSRRPGAGWATPPALRIPGSVRHALGEPAGVRVVVGQAVDHAVGAVLERDQPGRGEDPGLAHARRRAACARDGRGR